MINIRDNPQHTDIDGSILWVIDTYTEDEWFHTLTKLNKYCFLIHEESDYLDYINPIARQNGAYCSNLLDFIEYYKSEGYVIHKEHNVKDKSLFKLTPEGKEQLEILVNKKQASELESCLETWDEMFVLNLVDEVYTKYPEYSLP